MRLGTKSHLSALLSGAARQSELVDDYGSHDLEIGDESGMENIRLSQSRNLSGKIVALGIQSRNLSGKIAALVIMAFVLGAVLGWVMRAMMNVE